MTGLPPVLYGPDNRPLPSSGANPFGSNEVSRIAGGMRGTLSNWLVSRTNNQSQRYERQNIADRADDLAANDTHAASSIDSMATNTIGTGLQPQSKPNGKVLGWTEDQVKDFQAQAEWAWHIWEQESDAAGRLSFWQNCLVGCRTLLIKGEFFRIPLMVKSPERTFGLAFQAVEPLRVYTPSDMTDRKDIRDGIEFGKYGRAIAVWVANPDTSSGYINNELSSADFTRVKCRVGHRPGILHPFIAKTEEQMRGISILAPAMKFFKDLNDYLDFELVGAIIASSFPVFIETNMPFETAGAFAELNKTGDQPQYHEAAPGRVMYGNINQKPHVLKSDRPGNSFDSFVERILRGIGASIGMPYEVISKDFSKTNYSSARAALLEAWRVFSVYQKWMVDGFCQPAWKMVLEEAWLRGMIILPKGSPDWYDAMHAYTRATWIPPRKGHVDPLKEIKANILAIQHNISTLSHVTAEMGGADYETNLQQRASERGQENDLDIIPPGEVGKRGERATVPSAGSPAEESNSEESQDDPIGDIKNKLDAYGVGVRAGGLTPHQADEESFRQLLGLPNVSDFIKTAWKEDEGFRRPITLSSGQLDVKNEGASVTDDYDDDDAE